MAWEAALFKRMRLGGHRHCLALIEANAGFAPMWERCCLAMFAGLGPWLARLFGADTRTAWARADAIIADLFAASGLEPREVAARLRSYVALKLKRADHLPFEQARAEIYEQGFYPLVTHLTFALQPSAMARLKFLRKVAGSMKEAEGSVADLGCGSGVMLCEVLRMKTLWQGYGLDISAASINYARRLAAHKGVAARADFRTGDIKSLPYEDESLSLVIASEVIEHVPAPQHALREIARVLKPGGQLVLTVPVESHTPAHLNTLETADDLRSLCEDAGLHLDQLETRWHLGFGDDPRHTFARALKSARPLAACPTETLPHGLTPSMAEATL